MHSKPTQAPWWMMGHALVGVSLSSMVCGILLANSALAWAVLGVGLAVGALVLQWKMGRVDASLGRGHTLKTLQSLLSVSAFLLSIALVNPIFTALFVAFPLVIARLPFPHGRKAWVMSSAAASLLLWTTELTLLSVFAISLAALLMAVFSLRPQQDRVLTAYLPEESLKLRRPAFLLQADPERRNKEKEASTTDTLHQLVSMARASLRGRFAGVFWLDAEQQKMTPAIVETSTDIPIFDRALALDTVFPGLDLFQRPSQQVQLDGSPAWYLEARLADAQLLISHVVDDGIALGLLIVERPVAAGPFESPDFIVAEHCAKLCAQQLRQERASLSAARTSHDLRLVARAAELLSDTLSEAEVYRLGEELFLELLGEVEVAFLTLQDGVLHIAHATEGWAPLKTGHTLTREPSLVTLAIQRRHSLPYRPEGESDDPALFGSSFGKIDPRHHLVIPLVSGREAHSAVVLRVNDPQLLRPSLRERLQLVSTQLAAALGIARAYESMVVRATTDGMTRLLNHMTFRDQSAQAVERAQRTKRPLSVLLLDIDHFKSVNDTYGHGIGDDVIRAVAKAVREQVRRVDIAARYGGEEFAVVLENTGEEGALLFAERLRMNVEALVHESEQGPFSITISIGVAVFPHQGSTAEELVENADAALYVSKRSGRNRVSVWSHKASLNEHVA